MTLTWIVIAVDLFIVISGIYLLKNKDSQLLINKKYNVNEM